MLPSCVDMLLGDVPAPNLVLPAADSSPPSQTACWWACHRCRDVRPGPGCSDVRHAGRSVTPVLVSACILRCLPPHMYSNNQAHSKVDCTSEKCPTRSVCAPGDQCSQRAGALRLTFTRLVIGKHLEDLAGCAASAISYDAYPQQRPSMHPHNKQEMVHLLHSDEEQLSRTSRSGSAEGEKLQFLRATTATH